MRQDKLVIPRLVNASIEQLRAEADAMVSDWTAGLSLNTVYRDRLHLAEWSDWADKHHLRRYPADPVAIAAHVVEMFEHRRPSSTIDRRRLALWHAHGSPSGPDDPTAMARQIIRHLMSIERVVTPVGPAPVLGTQELVRMVHATAPTLDAQSHHAQFVLGWELRHAGRLAVTVGADDLFFDVRGRSVAVTVPIAGTLGCAEVVLQATPDPLRCPVRAARFLADYRGADPLLADAFRVRRLSPPGHRTVNFGEQWRQFRGWTDDDAAYAVEILAKPLRRAARDRAYICVGYAAPALGGNLRSVRIEHLSRTKSGYRLAYARDKSGSIALDSRDDPLDPVDALDYWLSIWPFGSGPLLPGEMHPDRVPQGGPRAGMTVLSQADCLRRAAATANLGVVPTLRSLPRSRAAQEWDAHHDIVAIADLLGNKDAMYTWDYLMSTHPLLASAAREIIDKLSAAGGDSVLPSD